MPLTHYSDRHLVKLLATESRRTDTSPHELASSHVALGRFLGGELLEYLALEPREIQHPQGVRQGWQVAQEHQVALIVLMRAGLYAGEGVREVLKAAPMLHVSAPRGRGLREGDLGQLEQCGTRTCVLIDSVVNTGGSIEPVLGQLGVRGMRAFVLSLVAPRSTAERLAAAWPEVHFLLARVSDNQYVGTGATDTGNRLFGTIVPGEGRSP